MLNLCQAFWASWTPCYNCWVRHILTLVYFHYLDKNPEWVIDGYGNDDFPEDYYTCGQPVDVPREKSFLYTSAIFMWRLCLIIRDVINTCDDTIHNLSAYVCDWSLGTHKILHPILSLKLGVTFYLFVLGNALRFNVIWFLLIFKWELC